MVPLDTTNPRRVRHHHISAISLANKKGLRKLKIFKLLFFHAGHALMPGVAMGFDAFVLKADVPMPVHFGCLGNSRTRCTGIGTFVIPTSKQERVMGPSKKKPSYQSPLPPQPLEHGQHEKQ
jgi:hypothetical protein